MKNSIAFIYQRSFVNKLKKALRRPVTYIAAIGVAAYIVMMMWSFGMMADQFAVNTVENLAAVLSMIVFFLMPADIISYAKRKGLIFKASDVHFIFPAPENPKQVLIFASIKNYIALVGIGGFVAVFGALFFDIAPWRMLLYFLFFGVLENILEGSMIIICYGNQTLPKRFFKVLTIVMYLLLSVFVLAAIYQLYANGPSFNVITDYLQMPAVQLVPVVGWAIAFVHLLIVGPTTINIVCTAGYVIAVILLFLYARNMECTGEYYEDAMTFAEDYAVSLQKAKKGEVTIIGKKKKKYVAGASVEYKGAYAKAIYYRQLLEYKKNRFFVFGWNTLLNLGLGLIIVFLELTADLTKEFEGVTVFIVPGIMAYMIFVFSGYATKWSKELENPYTYLIPDTGMRKLWYATKIEHIRSFIDGCLITIPAAIVLKLNIITTILTILLYVCLIANKLYLNMLAQAILGNTLGNMGKNLLRTLIQGVAMLLAIIGAVVVGIFAGVEAGFAAMILITGAITLGAAFGASTSFDRLESYE